MTNRLYCYAKGIADNNCECEIVVCIPTETDSNIRNKESVGEYNGTSFRYSTNNTIRSRSFFKRRIDDILGYTKTFFYLISKTKRDDVVVETSKSRLWYFFLFIARYFRSFKLVYELNEYPLVTTKQTKKIELKRKKLEKFAFSRLNGVIAISETLKEYATAITKAQIIKVPIIIDKDTTNNITLDTPPIDTPYIFHSGTLTERKDGVCGMLEAFGIAKPSLPQDARFILTGNLEKSPDKEKMKEIIRKYDIGNSVEFVGYLDLETLRRYQKYCSLVIINKYPTEQNKYCFATKTGEYLAFSRPIIMTRVGEAMNYFKDKENAYIVEPNDSNHIAEKIIDIFKHPDEAKKIGERGFLLTESDFNYKTQGKKMIDFFKSL
ncbi:MAG: glycosyltransferase family 4 protein [Bacteroidaceae bacterium]|nr:glycosyltransferase family 4 protein [Bacteroidaceae bacterium]